MIVSEKTIEKLASLSKLTLTKEEEKIVAKELEKILKQVEPMKELNTEGVKPTSRVLPIHNVFREDIPSSRDNSQDLLMNAPGKKGSYFLVPQTLE